ncbi:hypothetical protein [Pedobacter sp. Hv1]|uniref:hypothetical protein n=1 Tax=Pedobacter sp. Hv1 TaxID=1740090 RepID=UPI00128EAD39|nr:hypothetical protein [Pedobacter sp. Hv1]
MPKKRSEEEIIREMALETIEIQKHTDRLKAKHMFAADRTKLEKMKLVLAEVKAGNRTNLEWLKRECDFESGHTSEQAL